ncbi:MFS transporter [Deinococcus hohokamensis]|uniref:MFS transporter n=1 Tax=Deinococcus hohokamensis TaxID=309883 RepID=A0ABV9I7E0_9DEIO
MSLPADHPAPPQTLSVGLLLVVLVVAFEAMAVGTVLPRVAAEFHGLAWYGWASSAFLLASLFGAVASGLLADRRGLALGAGASLSVFAAGLLVAGLAPDMPTFVVGRFVQGLGAGGLGALPFAVITARYPEAARARMLAAVSSAWLVPALTGPLLASLIAETWSWRAVFWGLAPVLALVTPLCVGPLRTVNGPAPAAPEADQASDASGLWPALGLTVSAGAVVEGLRRADVPGLLLVVAGAVGMAFSARPLFPAGMLRLARGLPAALMLRGFAAFAVLGANTLLPLALHDLRGLTLTQAGSLLSVGGATWTLGSWIQAQLDRRGGPAGRPRRIRMGAALLTLGLGVTSAAVLGTLPLAWAYAGWCLTCLCMGVAYNANSLLALGSVPDSGAGRLSGQLANIEVLMVAVAAGVGGALVARLASLEAAFTLAFAVTLLGSLVPWVAATRLRPGA